MAALRLLLRKAPALSGALRSPAPLPRLSSPSLQALAPAAGARSVSQAQATAAGQTVHTGETLRDEGDRVHAELMQKMKILQEERDKNWRLGDEQWAKLRRQLVILDRASSVLLILSVASLTLQVSLLM